MEKYLGVKIILAIPMMLNQAEELLKRKIQNNNEDGYLVEYEDGYKSWSPKEVFEKAYRKTDGLTFGLAIEAMKKGKKVARKGWNGKGIFIELQIPNELSKMTHPYIYIDTTGLQTDNEFAPKDRVPWLASQADMLSEDWEIVE